MARTNIRMGWIPDLPDRRDHLYSAPPNLLVSLPASVDLAPKFPRPPYDQGQVGSCTGNGIAGAIEFDRAKQKLGPDFIPSRLFIYYNERAMEHTVNSDAGAMIRDGIKSVSKLGVCPEDMWTYEGDTTPDNGGTNNKVFTKPDPKCYTEAKKHVVVSYLRLVQSQSQLKGCLAAGYPFVFGFTCYDSLMSDATAKTGDISLPTDGEGVIGGHCVVAVGYDEATRLFKIRNSWGATWGNKGYGTIPYSYLTDSQLATDMWTIRTIKS